MAHGGGIVVAQLAALGVERVFSVPGESFLAVLDGLHDARIANVVCRHEGGAAMMAEATAKLTGRPGVAFATRGPGAANAAAGVHVARQDSTPMLLFVGQIDTAHRGREAFQEVDYRAVFGNLAKWAVEIDDPRRLPELIARAWAVATSGRPGPVVVALPENVLSAEVDVPLFAPPAEPLVPDLSGAARTALDWLAEAKRPLVVVGGPHWSAAAARDLATFAEAQQVPVALGFRRQDYLDNRHPCYAGDLNVGPNPLLAERLAGADRLLVIGSRLGDIETRGYTSLDPAAHDGRLFMVHADPLEAVALWQPEHTVTARAPDFVAALAALPPRAGWPGPTAEARAAYDRWITPKATAGAVRMEEVVRHLSDTLPEDAILTNGAGNYAAFLHRYFGYKRPGTQLAPTSGSMGYGFPAAVAASVAEPGRTVVCLAGDGCFQMTLNEMSTAMQHGATPVVIVANNGQYATIRMHQEKHYPGRRSGTGLANPDYAALARAYGGQGWRVTRQDDFPAALEAALACGTLAVIELELDESVLGTGGLA